MVSGGSNFVVVVEMFVRDAQSNHVIRIKLRGRDSQLGGAGTQTATDDSNAPYWNSLGIVLVESVVFWSLVGEDASCGQPIFVTGRSQNTPRAII